MLKLTKLVEFPVFRAQTILFEVAQLIKLVKLVNFSSPDFIQPPRRESPDAPATDRRSSTIRPTTQPHQHRNWQSMCAHKNVKHAHLIAQTPISQAFRLDALPSQGAQLEQLIDRSAPASHKRIAKLPAQRSLSLIPDSLTREIIQRHSPPIIATNKASWPQRGRGM